jgi:hypothetical protein
LVDIISWSLKAAVWKILQLSLSLLHRHFPNMVSPGSSQIGGFPHYDIGKTVSRIVLHGTALSNIANRIASNCGSWAGRAHAINMLVSLGLQGQAR